MWFIYFINFIFLLRQEWIRMGVEGQDWVRENGSYKITRPLNEETGNFIGLNDLRPGAAVYGSVMILGDDFAARNPAIPQEYHNVARTMYATKQRIGVDAGTVWDYNFETFFFDGPNYSRLNIDVGNELLQLCMVDGDLRGAFDNWLAERHLIIDPVLDELNAAFAE